METKQELLSILKSRQSTYGKVHLKGAFFKFDGNFYPIKAFFIPIRQVDQVKKTMYLDYGDILLVEEWLDINTITEFLQKTGDDKELQFGKYTLKIPKGCFRHLNENSHEIMENYGISSPLNDAERKLIRESRSYPKSIYRKWPSKAFLFQYQKNDLRNFYLDKKSKRRSGMLKKDLPAFLTYDDAITWWLARQSFHISDWSLIFIMHDFKARIEDVRTVGNKFIFHIKEGTHDLSRLISKYSMEFEDFSFDVGTVDHSTGGNIEIPNSKSVHLLYYVLCDFESPEIVVDYRKYDWRRFDPEDLDIKYEVSEEDIAYWLSVGENENLEYKSKINANNPKKFLTVLCSFCNTSGGRIILGVDDNANVVGLDDSVEKYQQRIGGLVNECIEPKVEYRMHQIIYQERQLLSIVVFKGSDPPYNYKNHGVYIRINSTSRTANRAELLNLMSKDKGLY